MEIKNLTMSFGVQKLYDNVNIYIKEQEKTGIVGLNGTGKTTLFKIMLHLLEPDSGKIIFENSSRIEWLPQVIEDEVPSNDLTVYEFLSLGRPIDKLIKKLQKLYEDLANITDLKEQNKLYNLIDKTQKKLEYWHYYSAESDLLKIIDGMNISVDLLNQKLLTLSGGQKSKVAFAKLLYSNPEVMLLDEPTNHLDPETKDFVTNYLKNYKGSVFVISHDIKFLNEITTQILYLDKRIKNFKLYEGNYDRFKKLNTIEEENLINQAKIQDREEKKLRTIINKYATSSGKRKRMAQDREKKLAKLQKERINLLPKVKNAKVIMEMARESNNVPLQVKDLKFQYSSELPLLIDNLNFNLTKGEKFLIVGENGVGKSTLLKLIMGILTPVAGEIIIGNKTDIGYYAQEHELLDYRKNILDNFKDIQISEKILRNVLGRFLFFGDDVYKKVSVLSPGEKSRVALAKLSLKKANFLILDEPTNHLDPETQMIIAETFREFKGTMLVVSHNPEFVDNLGIERILLLPSGEITYYNREIVEYFKERNSAKKAQ